MLGFKKKIKTENPCGTAVSVDLSAVVLNCSQTTLNGVMIFLCK